MIPKIILVMFLALFSLFNFHSTFAYSQLSANLLEQTHTLYCAESDSDENTSEYGDDEEPDCD